MLGFAEIFILFTRSPVLLVLKDRQIMLRHQKYDVMCDHACCDSAKKSTTLQICL